MCYLLDELMAYEEGFGDILMGDRASECHKTFMGAQDMSASISRGDLLIFEARLLQQMWGFLTLGSSPPNALMTPTVATGV